MPSFQAQPPPPVSRFTRTGTLTYGRAPHNGFSQGGTCPDGLGNLSGCQAAGRREHVCAESQRPGLKTQPLCRLVLWPWQFATPLQASVSTSVKWGYHGKAVGRIKQDTACQVPRTGPSPSMKPREYSFSPLLS